MLVMTVIFVFLATLIMSISCYNLLTSDKRLITRRLKIYTQHSGHQPAASGEMMVGKSIGVSGFLTIIKELSRFVELTSLSRKFEDMLIQAGIPLRGSEFVVICGAFAVLSAGMLTLLSGKLFLGIVGALTGFLSPVLFLRVRIERRTTAFNNQLGDALVLISNSLRTGYSFMQSLEMVAREMPRPIAEEFERVLKEMNLGIATEEAMNNLAKRVNSDDLDLVITAVLIQRQVGGNLAEVLDNIALTIRERVRIKGKVKTLTAQGRISGMIISLLPIAVGFAIYLLNPEYIKVLFIHPTGQLMLAAGVFSQIIGILLIRRIVNIDI